MPCNTCRCRKTGCKDRKGATLVLMVFLIVMIVGMTAFAVDLGIMYLDRVQIQNAVDSGALAANLQLKQNEYDVNAAIEQAEAFIQLNSVGANGTVSSGAITVEPGCWDEDTKTFTATNDSPTAVRVQGIQSGEDYFFARIWGKDTFEVVGSAVATGGRGRMDFCLVLDLSGSMAIEGRIEALRDSAPMFVNVIADFEGDDQIGVIGLSANPDYYDPLAAGHECSIYESGLHATAKHHRGVLEAMITKDFDYLRDDILSSLNLRAAKYKGSSFDGYTGTGAALYDAVHFLINHNSGRLNAVKVVVLMSDGHANRPLSSATQYALDAAAYADTNDVKVYTISLGDDADVDLMMDLAEITGANHFDATGSNGGDLTTLLTNAFESAALAAKRSVLVQ